MNSIVLLMRLQLRQSFGSLFDTARRKGARGKASYVIAAVVYVALVVIFGGLGYTAHAFGAQLGLGGMMAGLLLSAAGAFTFFMGVPSTLSSFFASSDIEDLLPLPLSELSISVSKALSALASSYLVPALLLVGPLIGWGLAGHEGALYWVVVVVVVLFAPMMPVAYAGVISILLASVFKRLRRRDTVSTLAAIVALIMALGGSVVGQLFNGRSMDANSLHAMTAGTDGALTLFPAYRFAVGALGGDVIQLLPYVVVSLIAFAVFVLFSRAVYLRIVTNLTSGGAAAKAYTSGARPRRSSVFGALVGADVRRVVRTSALMLNQVITGVIIGAITMGIIAWRTLPEALPAIPDFIAANPGVGDTLVAPFAISASLLYAALLSMGVRLSQTAVSREGSNWIHMKLIPVPYEVQLRAKIVTGVVSSALVALVIVVPVMLFCVLVMEASPLFLFCALVLAASGIWLGACIGVAADCSDPHVAWGNDGDVTAKTSGGGFGPFRSLIAYLVIAFLPLSGAFFTGLDPFVAIPAVSVAAAVAALVLGRRFIRKAARRLAQFEG